MCECRGWSPLERWRMLWCWRLFQGDVVDFVRKVALLEGELAEAHRAQEVAEEKIHNSNGSLAEGA
jgi:hypothetical protein